ncbi:7725_t:CDS:2 [Cetraspora pellucida]|uniref:7725_t:CDS:1 n=1 Tax=Cetraspora pellucida TaxID=1433469 RepID=A0ACA9K5W0_9GLOM|nr:7725_t:CDS:2 [Cetraspora pellucida]
MFIQLCKELLKLRYPKDTNNGMKEKYAYQIYLDVANPSHNYTYEEREKHWLNTRRTPSLELLKNLKEEQENDKISDPKMPLLYSNNKERNFNQTIHDSLQTKTKSYQEYCQKMQNKTNRQNTLCKQCLLKCKNKLLQTVDEQSREMCASCYTIKKEKAKEEALKDYFFNELLTTEQEILNELLYNYPLQFKQ